MSLVARARTVTTPANRPALDAVLASLQESEDHKTARLVLNVVGILSHIFGSALFLAVAERWRYVDAVYFCVVTITTVGYGDLTPSRAVSKLFLVAYIAGSLVLLSSILAGLVETLLDQQEELLLERLLFTGEEDEEQQQQASTVAPMDYLMLTQPQPPSPQQQARGNDGRQTTTTSLVSIIKQSFIGRFIIRATHGFRPSDFYSLALSTVWLCVILVLGMLAFAVFEHLGFIDSLYATVVSASTVGYGDYTPTHTVTRVVMTLWLVFVSTGLIKVIADFTDASVKAKQRIMTARLLTARMDLRTFASMDGDKDGVVDRSEFLAEMLVHMGKAEREEVDALLARFDQLDLDCTGKLRLHEVQSEITAAAAAAAAAEATTESS